MLMSKIIETLQNTIGELATKKLIDVHGGTRIGISQKVNHHNKITKLIGVLAMTKLCYIFRGCSLYIPKDTKQKLANRNRKIITDLNEGVSVSKLARKYDLSTRQIRTIIS